jgi:hypothetical protein
MAQDCKSRELGSRVLHEHWVSSLAVLGVSFGAMGVRLRVWLVSSKSSLPVVAGTLAP